MATKVKTQVSYTPEEERVLLEIANKPRNEWRPYLDKFMASTDRTYPAVWAKVNDLSYTVGNGPKGAKSKRGKSLAKSGYKAKNLPMVTKNPPVRRSSKIHPMKGGEMLVSTKEIRFPFRSIRLEAGEVIISI